MKVETGAWRRKTFLCTRRTRLTINPRLCFSFYALESFLCCVFCLAWAASYLCKHSLRRGIEFKFRHQLLPVRREWSEGNKKLFELQWGRSDFPVASSGCDMKVNLVELTQTVCLRICVITVLWPFSLPPSPGPGPDGLSIRFNCFIFHEKIASRPKL